MLRQGQRNLAQDALTAEDEIKEPYVLEFLDLRDEYSETDLESAMIARLEEFLLELGGDFAFVGRQRRLRVGNAWYRVDLLFFHRRLRCLVIIDIKLGRFKHADAGQMHLRQLRQRALDARARESSSGSDLVRRKRQCCGQIRARRTA